MGNEENTKLEDMKENYYLDVNFIAEGEKNQNDLINLIKSLKVKNINKLASQKTEEDLFTLFDYWDYYYDFNQTFSNQCNNIFLKIKKDNIYEFKSCLVVKVNHPNSDEVRHILLKMNEIEDKDFMPLVLFLCDNKITFSKEEYPDIDQRLIFSEKYSENFEDEDNPIYRVLMKFCSIFNELGDKFTIGKGDKVNDYCLTKRIFPFNINIICIGRIRQGKSTCVNFILNEMRARESNSGTSQTKKMTYYQVNDYPIKILDLPGFENKETVINLVKELKNLKVKLEKMKDRIHIILYVIDFQETTKFIQDEILIFEELLNHTEAKVIYVFTKSSKTQKKQKNIIKKTQQSIDSLIRNCNEKEKINNKMKISEDNSVFVNFIEDDKT